MPRGIDRRLRELERHIGGAGEIVPIAILHPSMIAALGFTPEERLRLVHVATDAELESWRLEGARGIHAQP